MAFSKCTLLLATVAALLPLAARAAYGDICTTFGAQCDTYGISPIYCGHGDADYGPFVCGGNGAACPVGTGNNVCYNYCGTDGICGSTGAGCDSTSTDQATVSDFTCATGKTCNLAVPNTQSGEPGTCGVSGSAAARSKKMKREQMPLCSQPGHKACFLGSFGHSGFSCIDVSSDLEMCGGCSRRDGGIDCSMLPNVDEVTCFEGSCLVKSCTDGFMLSDGECL